MQAYVLSFNHKIFELGLLTTGIIDRWCIRITHTYILYNTFGPILLTLYILYKTWESY